MIGTPVNARGGFVLLSLLASLALGCGLGPSICPRPETEEPIAYKGGAIVDDTYESSVLVGGERLHFPGGAFYEIHHELGAVPKQISFWLSFGRFGLQKGGMSLATGNQAELKAVDSQTLTVLNSSCADYWLYVNAAR